MGVGGVDDEREGDPPLGLWPTDGKWKSRIRASTDDLGTDATGGSRWYAIPLAGIKASGIGIGHGPGRWNRDPLHHRTRAYGRLVREGTSSPDMSSRPVVPPRPVASSHRASSFSRAAVQQLPAAARLDLCQLRTGRWCIGLLANLRPQPVPRIAPGPCLPYLLATLGFCLQASQEAAP